MTTTRLFAAGLLLLAAALPARAQTSIPSLQAGQTIQGFLTEDSPLANRFRHDCYELDTTPGSRWVIEADSHFDPEVYIGRGNSCAAVTTWDAFHDDINVWRLNFNARLRFNAGGGTYLIMVRSHYATGAGVYEMRVKREADTATRDLLPPGQVYAPPRIGTASTVQGPTPREAPGQTLRDCVNCPEMTVVQAGSFMMGSPASEEGRQASEGPRHLVTIGRAFAIGKYEVTFDEYDACVADRRCVAVGDAGWGRGRRPVINISHRDATLYAFWLSEKTGQTYFLPSEAEWEYAARAGTDTPWNTGSALLAEEANIMNQFGKTANVGGYAPNAWGLYDTHGNVGEWVQDCMDTGYLGASDDGRAATGGDCAAQRVARDNAWDADPYQMRSASRRAAPEKLGDSRTGFRVARAL